MRIAILLQIRGEDGAVVPVEEIVVFDKATERPEDLGLSIAEAKALLAAVQHRTVMAQAGAWSGRHRRCAACGEQRRSKGSYPIAFRTL